MATKKTTQKTTETPKVWYAVETYDNATDDFISCYESLEEAIDSITEVDRVYFAYRVELLGEVELTKKVEYKFKK